jgi:hypothetical protein
VATETAQQIGSLVETGFEKGKEIVTDIHIPHIPGT